MRYTSLPAIAFFLLLAVPSSGQTWTAEEQTLIDQVERCWVLWAEEDFDAYARGCPNDPAMRFWFMHEGMPNLGPNQWKEWAKANWPRYHFFYHEIRPVAIRTFGDVALYYYWVTYQMENPNGIVESASEVRLEVFQRRDGRWVGIGGAATITTGD